MARRSRIARMSRAPIAIAATRSMPRGNRLALASLAGAAALAALVSPPLAVGLVGLLVWQAMRR